MSEIQGQIIGLKETLAKAERLLGVVTSQDAQAITMFAARRVREKAQAEAPIGNGGSSRTGSRRPGLLRRSIAVRGVRRGRVAADGPAAFVLPRIYRGPAATRAPHAHLVAFGTRNRAPRTGGVLAFAGGGGMVFTRRARGLKPNDFMARAVATAGPTALEELSSEFDKLIVRNLKEGA